MRRVLPLLTVLSLAFAPAPPYRPKKDVTLAGAWIVVQDHAPGQPTVKVTFLPAGKSIFEDDSHKFRAEEGAYIADSKRFPPQIDFLTPARKARGRPALMGVYKMNGDILTLYLSETARPKKLGVQEGRTVMVMTLRRAK